MEKNSIYADIAQRTGGDIYIGVVGPVRTGKSTFIKRFMEGVVLPNIEQEAMRARALDELPQSASGRTIMTTEPKFVPEQAVEVALDETASPSVRLIDCVGYIVPSALGYIEESQPRMVMTPWFDEEIPFNMAAEIGTQRVINEHATLGLVITTDGSITDIPRAEYREAEERVIDELRQRGKPFVVLLNCVEPTSPAASALAEQLSESYALPVLPVNCLSLSPAEVREILAQVLYQFPVREIAVELPRWVPALPGDHWLKSKLYQSLRDALFPLQRMAELDAQTKLLTENEYIDEAKIDEIDFGEGSARLRVQLSDGLFYRVLGESTGFEIADEEALLPLLCELAQVQREYERLRGALEEVEATGYGIVAPTIDQMKLEPPEMIKQGGQYGVRLKASAPSIHMMRADITTEVAPIVGGERQSEDLVKYLLAEFEQSPEKIWDSNIFGKSLYELVNEGVRGKLYRMPPEARQRLTETIQRVINEGCTGLICIIL